MTAITIVKGDKNFLLNFTIYDADDQIVDLTGASTITLKFKSYEDGTVTSVNANLVDHTPAQLSAGEVHFFIGSEFVSITGEFKAEIEITYDATLDNRVITAPNISIKVIPDLT